MNENFDNLFNPLIIKVRVSTEPTQLELPGFKKLDPLDFKVERGILPQFPPLVEDPLTSSIVNTLLTPPKPKEWIPATEPERRLKELGLRMGIKLLYECRGSYKFEWVPEPRIGCNPMWPESLRVAALAHELGHAQRFFKDREKFLQRVRVFFGATINPRTYLAEELLAWREGRTLLRNEGIKINTRIWKRIRTTAVATYRGSFENYGTIASRVVTCS